MMRRLSHRLVQRSELRIALWNCRREFAVCLLFSAIINLLMLTPTIYMLQLFDRVLVSYSVLTLLALSAILLFFFALLVFSEWSRARLLVRLSVKLDSQLNSRIFKASLESSVRQQGDSSAQAISDLASMRQFLTGNGLFAFIDAPWTPIYLIVLFLLHPWLGALGLAFSLIMAALTVIAQRRSRDPLTRAADAQRHAASFLDGKFRNAEVVEVLGMQRPLFGIWSHRHRQHLAQDREASDSVARMGAFSRFVRHAQQSLTLGAAALLMIRGELTAGAMIAANVLAGRAMQPLETMTISWQQFLAAREAFRRLEALLAQQPQQLVSSRETAPLRGEIRLEHLTAISPLTDVAILKGMSAVFAPGAVVGILGPSGSGKSTLARVLLGIWPRVEGRMLLDGTPIETWNRTVLGPRVGYLPQEIELFEGTVAENIARFGAIDADKVVRAAQHAGVHEIILRLPQGYDTPIGEAGRALSGGQRQRIGLARALYGDPQLVVLDEPDANLDDAGQAALVRAVRALKQLGSTVFIISHRTRIIAATDRLLTLGEGTLVSDEWRNPERAAASAA